MLCDNAGSGGSGQQAEAVFVIDERQRIVQWSDAAASLLATPADSALGQPCHAVVRGLDPFGRPICRPDCRAMQAVRAGHLMAKCTLATDRGAAAPRLQCELRALPRDTGGAIVRVVGCDAGREELAAASSLQGPQRPAADLLGDLTSLAALATSLSAGTILDRLDALLDLVREATRSESAELFLAEPIGGDLLLTAYRGPFRRAFCQMPRFGPGEGFPGLAVADRQPVLTANLGADPRYLRTQVKERGFRSYICMPLSAGETSLGAICVSSRRGDACSEDALRFLTWASIPIATALCAGLLQANRNAMPDATSSGDDDDGDPHRLLHEILHRIRLLARADGATLVLRLPEGPVGRVLDGVLAPPTCPYLDSAGTPERCPVLDRGQSVALYGPRHDWPPACQRLRRQGGVTYCLPLPVDEKLVGILHLAYRDDPPCPPTRQLGPLMQISPQAGSLVRMAWRSIEQLRLVETASTWLLPDEGQPASPRPEGHATHASGAESMASGVAVEPRFHIRCFGAFELRRAGLLVAPEAFKRRQALTLLKILLMHAGRPVPKEALIEMLWPESAPDAAARRLHVVVHALREVMEGARSNRSWDVIRSGHDGYAFAPSVPYWFDVEEFHAAIEAGRGAEERGAKIDAVRAYDAAIHLYRGEFCEDDRFAEWCWLEREQLRETYLDTLERLAALWVALGEPDRAIHRYRELLRADPLREAVQYRLMESLWAAGRPAEALQHFELFRDLLRQELDIDPSPETAALMRRVRATLAR